MNNNSIHIFNSKIFVSGHITAHTGLHVGGSSTEMSIGGADSVVIRNPITNHPYIPGSSLRGKMRSLFEKARKELTFVMKNDERVTDINELKEKLKNGAKLKSCGPSIDPEAIASKLFGVSVDAQRDESPIPQRLIVRDAKLKNPDELKKAKNTDMPLTEVKTEVNIDRITSKAHPRQIERVPAGAKFDFEFVLTLFEGDDQNEYLNYLYECMSLLEDDYLGGHGARGYGKVKFCIDKIELRTAEAYRENQNPTPLNNIPDKFCCKCNKNNK